VAVDGEDVSVERKVVKLFRAGYVKSSSEKKGEACEAESLLQPMDVYLGWSKEHSENNRCYQ